MTEVNAFCVNCGGPNLIHYAGCPTASPRIAERVSQREAFENLTPAQVLKARSRHFNICLTCENAHADVCSACMGTGLMRKPNKTIADLAARVVKLERAIMDTVDLLKEGEDNATEGLGPIACSDAAKLLVKAL